MNHKDHWGKVAELKCCVCQGDANIHHCLGGSMIDWFGGENSPRGTRNNHWLVIPLCHRHHQGADGLHAFPSIREWESVFGSQVHHLLEVNNSLPYSLWDEAELPDPDGYAGPESYAFGRKAYSYEEYLKLIRGMRERG